MKNNPYRTATLTAPGAPPPWRPLALAVPFRLKRFIAHWQWGRRALGGRWSRLFTVIRSAEDFEVCWSQVRECPAKINGARAPRVYTSPGMGRVHFDRRMCIDVGDEASDADTPRCRCEVYP